MIDQAFILAAGYATRMRPISDHIPKPMALLGERPILGHIIDKLIEAGVTKIIINGHHKIEKLHEYMPVIQSVYPDVNFILSEEDAILETGGGVMQAMQYLDPLKPFYMINGDAFWTEPDGYNTLKAIEDALMDSDNDMVLLLQSTASMQMTEAKGDYMLSADGRTSRIQDKTGTHMFTGIRALYPKLLDGYEIKKFSFLEVMDDAEAKGVLGGIEHKGHWYHISTPQDLVDVNNALFSWDAMNG